MDTEMNATDQLSVESSATFTSDFHSVDELSAQDNLTIAQHYVDLASTLSEAVPSIAPALEEVIFPVLELAGRGIVAAQINVREIPATASLTTSPQELESMRSAIIAITDNYHHTLMEYYAERLRQARMSFNTTLALIVALIIVGTLMAVGGVIVTLVHNIIVGVPLGLAGAIVDAISIVRAFNKETNDRLDPRFKELLIITQFRSANEYIEKINDIGIKDKALVELINEIEESIKWFN